VQLLSLELGRSRKGGEEGKKGPILTSFSLPEKRERGCRKGGQHSLVITAEKERGGRKIFPQGGRGIILEREECETVDLLRWVRRGGGVSLNPPKREKDSTEGVALYLYY